MGRGFKDLGHPACQKSTYSRQRAFAQSATPQKRLTFSPEVIVTSIEAENQGPQATASGSSLRPAMSVNDADKVIEDLAARFGDGFVKCNLGPFTSGEWCRVVGFGKRGSCEPCITYRIYLTCRLWRMEMDLLHQVRARRLHR